MSKSAVSSPLPPLWHLFQQFAVCSPDMSDLAFCSSILQVFVHRVAKDNSITIDGQDGNDVVTLARGTTALKNHVIKGAVIFK